jgi:hypothetical protein
MAGFETALVALKTGKAAYRTGWNGKGMWVKAHYPVAGLVITLPYIFMRTADGEFVPWLASQTDLLADDWVVEGA